MSSFKELNITNPGTSSKYGGDDTDLINKLFNGVTSGIPAVKIKSQNKFGFWDGIAYIRNQADTKNTTIRGQSNSPATDVDLRLPPITSNDVLPALNLTQAWLKQQQFNLGMTMQEMDDPANPGVSFHHIYVGTDGHLKGKNSSGLVRDYDLTAVLGSTLFADQTLQLMNPLGTATLTMRNPPITSNKYGMVNLPGSYYIFDDGVSVFAKNMATGAIDQEATGTTAFSVIFLWVLTALVTTGGHIGISAGTHNMTIPIVVPNHSGLSITIQGSGWRNTKIQYTGALDNTNYLIDSYGIGAGGWQIIDFKDIQIWGGTSTSNRLIKVLRLGRNNGSAAAHYRFYNVRIANGLSPQITCDYVQDSYWYMMYAESFGSTPTGIVDIEVKNSSHVNLFGCSPGVVTVDQSRYNMFGGTMQQFELKVVGNYTGKMIGTFFDPAPAGYTHQIIVGSTGNVVGYDFDNIGFSSNTNTPSTDRYFYINNARNIYIRNPKFMTSHTLTKTIEFTSSATGCFLWLQNQEDITKVLNNSTSTTIYNPNINNTIIINNPSGTIGADIVDSFTGNRLQLANAGLHLVNAIKSSSGSARWKLSSRNAANNADIVRMQTGNLQNQGAAPVELLEAIDQTVITTPADPAAGHIRYYPKQINANNDALFIKQKVAGSVVEVQVS